MKKKVWLFVKGDDSLELCVPSITFWFMMKLGVTAKWNNHSSKLKGKSISFIMCDEYTNFKEEK